MSQEHEIVKDHLVDEAVFLLFQFLNWVMSS